ncbi:DNA replication/repair protein RecF [Pelotomaculum propionicicum]|uniref:DNA replication/repair protein RecF n=1 Tax=Pelotomaculum propionicicum TaxID=258475 RepID=UPI003B7DAEBB
MYLKRLEIANFRNYSSQVIEPDNFFNVFSGSNAQGKTNLLESIFLSCTGKSFRTQREAEIISWQKDFSYINSLFETDSRQVEVRVELLPGKKKIGVNGVLTRGYPLGWPGVVLFKPEDLVLVKGSPFERRRFLDLEFGPFLPQYNHLLGQYNRVLFQRNNLLRDIKEKKSKSDSLQVWNDQLCRYGARLLSLRIKIFKDLSPLIRNIHHDLTGKQEDLDIRYLSSLKLNMPSSEDDLYGQFQKGLREVEEEEIKRSQTLIGPHRDDFALYINDKDARTYGSQGQQRTIVLTLKISQILHWHKEIGEYPILLLDDVLFELDEGRRRALLNRVRGFVQTFVTSTGEHKITVKDNFAVKKFFIRSGRVADTKEE